MDKQLNFIQSIQALSKYIRGHRRNFVQFYLGNLVSNILMVVTPILFAVMIDQIVYYRNLEVFFSVSLVFMFMAIFMSFNYIFTYTQHHYLHSKYTFDIRMDLFKKMQNRKAYYMSNSKTGDLISVLFADTKECMHFVNQNITGSITLVMKGIFYLFYIYIISLEAGIVVTLFIPFAVYATFRLGRRMRKYTNTQREFYGNYVSWLSEILRGLADLRLLTAEKTIRKDFTGHQRRLFQKNVEISVSNLASAKLVELITLLLQLSVFGVCAYLAVKGEITIGNVMVLIAFVFALKDETITWLVHSYMEAQSRLTRISRVHRFLNEEDETTWPGLKELVVTSGQVEFEHLHFAYEKEKVVLVDLNLVIPGGRRIAIVGKSGCGKTTLSALLIGLYDPSYGTIRIDGQELTDCTLKSIRDNIGIVQQDVLMFDATIRENLLLGNPKATDDEIWAACSKAGIADHFETLPEKLETLLGKGGQGLSGGQRQRLAIARIYLKNPPIIVFDEATSALDSETERILHESWGELLQGRTSIVIAHRLSSVLLCDQAALIEDGRVKVMGNPEQLLREDPIFRELFAVKEELEHV